MAEVDSLATSMFDENVSLVHMLDRDEINLNDELDYEPPILSTSFYYSNEKFGHLLDEKKDSFIVISLNCQSLNAKYELLKNYVENFNYSHCNKLSAVCLQETWLKADSDLTLFQLDGYNLISAGRTCSAHSGTAIYLHESYGFREIAIQNNSDIWDGQIIEIFSENDETNYRLKKLHLCNIYRPPQQNSDIINNFIDDMSGLFDDFTNNNHVIIAGDFNIDLLKFKENTSVNNFLDCVISHGYVPKITQPTRLTQRKGTLIDNFFMKLSNNSFTTTAGILLSNISDHLPYFICLENFSRFKTPSKLVKVFPSYLESSNKLKQELQKPETIQRLYDAFSLEKSVDENYTNFDNILRGLLNKYFQAKTVKYNKYKHKKSKWITTGIMKSIFYRDKLYVKLKSTSVNSIEYIPLQERFKTYNAILKRALREAKRLYYHSRFQNFKFDIKKTWNTINEILNKQKDKTNFPNYFLYEGRKITDPKEISNEFNSYYVNVGPQLAENIITPSNQSFKDYLQNPIQNQFVFRKVNEATVMKVIDSLKPKCTSGIDNISSKLLKLLKEELAPALTKLINKSLNDGIFPASLKIARVTPLFKKNDKHSFGNYRPVSVLSSISKVFEKVMYSQIYEHFSDHNLLYKSQYGFRSQHSTEYASLELVDRIIQDMDIGKTPINVYMDLSKAFDTLDHQILSDKLFYYGFRDKSFDLMVSYISNRKQCVNFNNVVSDKLTLKCGVPQGSILGPLLFIIYINDLPSIMVNFKAVVYADDTTLFTSLNVKSQNYNSRHLNDELCAISTWLKLNKLSLNVNKTKAMLFRTPQKQVNPPELVIDGLLIEFVSSFSFLGIIVDENLKWNFHINALSKKISKILGIMTKLRHSLPPQILLTIYNALILPHLTYGLLIWGWKSDRLFKLQKRAVRIVTGSKYNAHTSGLFKDLNILKLKDLCALQDYTFCYKLQNSMLPDYFQIDMNQRLLNVSSSHSYPTRQGNNLRLPSVRHEFARNSISYKYPVVMNNMPTCFKEKIATHSLFGFKYYFKTTTLQSYVNDCNLPNCFICLNS